jgi:hypothetical protein
MRVNINDGDSGSSLLLKSNAIRIIGTVAAGALFGILSLGAFDLLSQKALSRAVGIADAGASAPFNDWVPLSGMTVEDPQIALASPVAPEWGAVHPSGVAVAPEVASVAQPEAEPPSTPLPPNRAAGMVLASLDPSPDVSFDFDELPNDARDPSDDWTITTAAVPLPTPAPERPPLPPTPAERLKLTAKEREKAEKCLAQAVYFEARGERLRGQVAVAQVVMNRVFSPFYPNDVCGVIYQNAHRHLSCQFTFTCDGRPERVTERRSWRRAKYIAKRTLDGKTWVAEVAKSTHYHAVYVRPRWVREMKRMVRYGVHAFYRPRKWGDGSRETDWSNISNIAARAVIVE